MVNADKYICLPLTSANLISHFEFLYNLVIINIIQTVIPKPSMDPEL